MDAALRDDDAGSRADRRGHVLGVGVSALLIVAYCAYFAHVSTSAYRGYAYRTFDLGFYDQGVWLLSRFHAPYITLVGRNLFGDHAQFSLLALVPLYWIRPDASTLLNAQALVMALGAVPVYLLAVRRRLGPLVATVFVAAFLLHPALGQSNLENYHPDSFLIPVIGFAIYFAVEDRPRAFVIAAALALLCKEDAVLVVAPLALWFWWRRGRRVGGLVAAAAVVVAFLDTNVVMRSLVGVSTRNAFRIPFSTCARACSVTRHLSDFVVEIFTKPVSVVRYLVAGDRPNGRPFYAWQMIAPTGLAFLVAPEVAATAVLALAANVFSTVGFQHQIAFHYSMELLPALGMGSVYGVSRIAAGPRRTAAVVIVAASALTSAYLWGPLPFARHGPPAHWSPRSTAVAEINRVIAQLPAGAVVSAYDGYVTHVDHRRRVYLWPTPFAASHWKLGREEGHRIPEADDVGYLLLPARLDDHPQVFDAIRAGYEEIGRGGDARDGVVLYRRVSRGSS